MSLTNVGESGTPGALLQVVAPDNNHGGYTYKQKWCSALTYQGFRPYKKLYNYNEESTC